jgi:hypothetical protein
MDTKDVLTTLKKLTQADAAPYIEKALKRKR